ncbi:exosortase Q [Piscinibacter sp. XHJ-5]|uniref:exosortase Q n=1 Tax=Piscinibacter sp. XHJ-5 TaxID=3037797 RepID=UPI0024529944|nr:exosortase Q [Piscinibacter sp. XHJ-5]
MNRVIFTTPGARWSSRIAAIPPWGWLALQAAALWVHWRWAAARMADGSDDPLGVAALGVLAWAVWRLAPQLRGQPRPAWLAAALLLSAASTAAVFVAPPLVGALLAALALACGLRAFMPTGQPTLPLAGLAVLALPVVSSLQFYAGYPLRLATAQLSAWTLQLLGWSAQRAGASLVVDGRLVIVDAPCAGVQMVWMAYFCACAVALFTGIDDRRLLRRLPWTGAIVLLGNVLRNSVLVALEARGDVAAAAHQGVGLVVLAAVCTAVAALVVRAPGAALARPLRGGSAACGTDGWRALFVGVAISCALLPLAHTSPAPMSRAGSESPIEWEGRELRPLALTAVEQRFADRFPGRIARLTDGEQVLVWREVTAPTRMLHPATDCYRGLGYRIEQARLERDGEERLWRCFVAERDGMRLRVCERIVDARGQAYTDASSWFWAAQLGQSTGPWQAITLARPL